MIVNLIRNKLKGDFYKVYFFDMIAKAITVITSIIIIRGLHKNDYAQYTVFNSIGSFISGVLGSGIGLAYTRYAVLLREKEEFADGVLYKNLRYKMQILVSVLLLFGIVLYKVSGKLTNVHILGGFYGLVLALYQLNVVFFQAREQYSIGGIVSNIKNILLAISLLILFVLPITAHLEPVLLLCTSAIFISLVITNGYINKNLKRVNLSVSLKESNRYFVKMLKDSIWIILYMFMLSAFNQLDIILLTSMRPAEDVANYGVAYKYYSTVLSLLPAIQVVLRVKNSSYEITTSKSKRKELVILWLKKSIPLAIILYFFCVIGSYFVFPIINGVQYNAAIVTFDILLFGACLSYVTAPNVSVMLAAGKQKVLFYLSIGSFLINLVGNILFIPEFGPNAAAITTILAHLFLNGNSTIIVLLEKNNMEKV